MIRKISRLITMMIIASLLLTLCLGAFAADTDVAFTIHTIDGYNAPIGGASFSLLGPNGSSVASATTGSTGYAAITIPSAAIADEGSTNFKLVQTGFPSGYKATDNNWEVTVTMTEGKAAVNIATNGLWDTIFDWIDGSVITGSEYMGGTLTVANIIQYYDIPKCTKTVAGLSYTQMQGYTSDYELTDASGRVVAIGHTIGFAVQEDESFKAPIIFDRAKIPAGTYLLRETSVTEIEDMDFEGSKFMNNNGVLIVSANGSGETVYAQYTAPVIHTPPAENENTSNTDTSDDNTFNNEEAETSEETEPADKNDEDKSKDNKVHGVEIDDEKVPKASKPESNNIKVWIIVALASVIMIVAVIIMSKRAKSNI